MTNGPKASRNPICAIVSHSVWFACMHSPSKKDGFALTTDGRMLDSVRSWDTWNKIIIYFIVSEWIPFYTFAVWAVRSALLFKLFELWTLVADVIISKAKWFFLFPLDVGVRVWANGAAIRRKVCLHAWKYKCWETASMRQILDKK